MRFSSTGICGVQWAAKTEGESSFGAAASLAAAAPNDGAGTVDAVAVGVAIRLLDHSGGCSINRLQWGVHTTYCC